MLKSPKVLSVLILLFVGLVDLVAGPKMEILEDKNFRNDKYNWGRVKESESPLKATLKIKNVGDAELHITKVKPGCGCTTAPLDKEKLAPGEVATVSVTMNVGGGHAGPISKSLTISSNDAERPDRIVSLEAELYKPLVTSPSGYFTFPNDAKVGQQYEAKLVVTNSSDKPITLSDFMSRPETVISNMKGKRTLAPKESVEVIVKYTPEKAGYFNISLQMTTDNPDQKDLILTGYGNAAESPVFNNK